MTFLENLGTFLWPAYAARRIDRFIDPELASEDDKKGLEVEERTLRQEILAYDAENLKTIGAYARQLHDSEGARKETLEAKAGTIAQSAGIVTAIVSILPAFSGHPWTTTPKLKWLLIAALGLAVIHLAMALRMAISVRSVRAFYLPSAHEFAELLAEKPTQFAPEVAALDLMRAKRNEAILGMKSNRLTAAEQYYQRGLFLFAVFILGALFFA